jgi:predicted anti-sigma-YlaC factor YlaD
MRCQEIREACSALVDGEDPGVPRHEIDAHLRGCQACRAFLDRSEMPDFGGRVAADVADAHLLRPLLASPVRVALLAVAVAQLALALRSMLDAGDHHTIHVSREVGACYFALAIGFLFAALRPLRAVGLLPFVAALSAALVVTAAVDISQGHAPAIVELGHLLEVVGTALLWLMVSPRPLAARRARATNRELSVGVARPVHLKPRHRA